MTLMASLGYDRTGTATKGGTPAALGNRIAKRIIEAGLKDGSTGPGLLLDRYRRSTNPRSSTPGRRWWIRTAGSRWPSRSLPRTAALPVGQEFIGPHWGDVTSFALRRPPSRSAHRPGPAAAAGGPGDRRAFKDNAVEVIRFSSLLDPRDGVTIDISPAALGQTTRWAPTTAPATRQPGHRAALRAERRATRRTSAGCRPSSGPTARLGDPTGPLERAGQRRHRHARASSADRRAGPELDPLEWDVKLYLALNGAVHDAAVAAWGTKGYYDYVASDLDDPLHGRPGPVVATPPGLRTTPTACRWSGLVEVITATSSAPGQRHAHLARPRRRGRDPRLGRQPGGPRDRDRRRRLDPRRRVDALPAPTFVTPPSPATSPATARSAGPPPRCWPR